MKRVELNKLKKIHFIGIGGIGMSALARLFLHDKKQVSGSDHAPSNITDGLHSLGIEVATEQGPQNITNDIDLVVYTEAIAKDHPELVAAQKKKIPTLNYFEALGLAVNPYYLIAVAGTHGKTTTTAMLTDIFESAGKDPTAIIGSLRTKTQSNFRAGKSKYAIVEACEYRRNFLFLEPDLLVITNIEEEHLDYFKGIKDIQDAFRELAKKVPEGGHVVCNAKDPLVKPVIEGLLCSVIDYSRYVDPLLKLTQPGLHNIMNAGAARATAEILGINKEVVAQALGQFAGTWRRFEYKGKTKKGALIYDDYAHHPTEIKAAIKGARDMHPDKEITVVFQPHLHSRTYKFFKDFALTLAGADHIIITDIYAARKEGDHNVSGEKLAEATLKHNKNTRYVSSFADIEKELKKNATAKDVVIIMGAGDVANIATELTM